MRVAKKVGLFVLFLPVGFAQVQPDIADILKKVSETYKSVAVYEFIADTSTKGAGADTAGHMLFAFKAPNLYRMEGAFPGLADVGDALVVDDGSAVWFYMRKSNQYGSFAASQLTADAPGDLGDISPEAMDYFMTSTFRKAATFAAESKFLREASINVAGVKADCFVVAVSQGADSVVTWWVDRKTYRILREDLGDTSIVFTTIKLGGTLPNDLFKFVPPVGAHKVETHVEPTRIPPPPPSPPPPAC